MAYSAQTFVAGEQPTAAKWNLLWSNDASFNDGSGIGTSAIVAASIAASAVTPEKLLTGTGTDWSWTSFTPSWGGITVGSGTNVGYYKQIGKTVVFQAQFVYGAGSSVSGGVYLSPPVAFSSNYSTSGTFTPVGQVTILDSGTANYAGQVRVSNSSSRFEIDAFNAAGTYAAINQANTTTPMTWTSSDELRVSGVYEAA